MFAWQKPRPGWDTQRLLSLVCLYSPDLECGSRKSRSPRSSMATELQVNLGHRRAYPIFYNSSLWPLVSADHSLVRAIKLCFYKNTYPSLWQIKMGYWICVFVLLCSGLFKLKCELGWLQNSASTCFSTWGISVSCHCWLCFSDPTEAQTQTATHTPWAQMRLRKFDVHRDGTLRLCKLLKEASIFQKYTIRKAYFYVILNLICKCFNKKICDRVHEKFVYNIFLLLYLYLAWTQG